MAIFLRRAFSLRNLLLPRSSALCGRELTQCSLETLPQRILPLPALEFVNESRRGFAKGHNKKDQKKKDEKKDKPPVEPLRNVAPTIKANASSQMETAITALIGELSKLRTGRAAPGMLDHIIVETGGVKLPLNQVALVSVMDSKTLSINPFDPSALKNLETAIVDCPLGINPKVGDNRLIAEIPPLTKEHVQAICKVVTKSCEDGKLSIRRARQKAIDIIKKMYNDYSKDDLKRLEKEVDDLTKEFVKQAEDLCKAKEKEISSG